MKKKVLSTLLALSMVLGLAACGGGAGESSSGQQSESGSEGSGQSSEQTSATDTYTFHDYTSALATKWNPHNWDANADDAVLSYLSSPFCTMQVLDSENGVYQWVYEMATSITDVTADHQDDLMKYAVDLPAGQTADQTTSGYVFEIALNPNAKWQDGTPINADTYIYSMKALLDPAMKNYRANLYYAGESAVAGGNAYYNMGSVAYQEAAAAYSMEDLTAGEDGVYTTPDGAAVYVTLTDNLSWLGDDTLTTYVETYGESMFGVEDFNALKDMADENGRVPLTDESLAHIVGVITAVADWGETEAEAINYLVYPVEYPVVDYDSTVGCYKVDDYTIRYVCQYQIDYNYFLTSCTSTWLVYEDLYEKGKDTTGDVTTTSYNTSPETTMSYGPYKLESMQTDKQMVLVQNENWYGYEKQEDGSLKSMTPYLVDGESIERYKTNRIVIDVMDDSAAKQAFLKGELSNWNPTAEDLLAYSTSDQLYKADETYTMSLFFNCGLDNLKEMDRSKGNQNSVVLSNVNFRKAMSLGIDRAEYVSATPGYNPAYSMLNSLYYYDVYNDPESSYRNTDEAMQAICNLYEVEYGEGTPYATLKDAYNSINGYNLTEAQNLMKTACDELVADGLYTAGDPILIRMGWAAGALDSAANQQVELLNKYVNAAAEGSGFGTITLEAVGNLENRYDDVASGEYAIGYGAWGGAAFYPFRNFQVYCDPSQYSINEAGCWDPTTAELTLNISGQEVTKTWQDWSNCMVGTGDYATADFSAKLDILAQLEENYLKLYYRLPLCAMTTCVMLAYQCSYYTEEYNIMYGYGGIELLQYNYTDAEWADFVASQGGTLNYE